jgi:hypothetical protein
MKRKGERTHTFSRPTRQCNILIPQEIAHGSDDSIVMEQTTPSFTGLTNEQVAEITGIAPKSLDQYRTRGVGIPFYKARHKTRSYSGKKIMVTKTMHRVEDLRAWLIETEREYLLPELDAWLAARTSDAEV